MGWKGEDETRFRFWEDASWRGAAGARPRTNQMRREALEQQRLQAGLSWQDTHIMAHTLGQFGPTQVGGPGMRLAGTEMWHRLEEWTAVAQWLLGKGVVCDCKGTRF